MLNKIKILFSSNKVGCDEFGNCYYEAKKSFAGNKKKRYVIYQGIAEPSKVPAEWHYWLHYTGDVPPVHINTHKYSWQKIHLPNLTGTKYAYLLFGKNRGYEVNKLNNESQSWNSEDIIDKYHTTEN